MPFVDPNIGLPTVFPLTTLDQAHTRVQTRRELHPDPCREFGSAWLAVAYRYMACYEHHEAFTHSVHSEGASPNPRERYIQERELFGFFYTGLSVIESCCYGVFAMAHILKPVEFPFSNDAQRRGVNPRDTLKLLIQEFPQDGLTSGLRSVIKSRQYKQCSVVRNVLTHRAHPGRAFHDGGEKSGLTEWIGGLTIDANTTATPYQWLTQNLIDLSSAAQHFSDVHF